MIYTFQKINSGVRVLLYALNKDDAFAEMRLRYGAETASEYSLIAYTEAEKFSLVLNS
mgnify:CR=1 FL=1